MVSKNDINKLKSYLSNYLMMYHGIDNLRKPFHCLNPTHPDIHPSMFYTDKYFICKCFACGVTYDIFNLIKMDYSLDDFKEQVKKVTELFDLDNIKVEFHEPKESILNKELIDYQEYFNKVYQNKCDYLIKRGIDESLIQKYKIGYDPKTNNVIFPINKISFFARNIYNNGKYKSSGESFLWNEKNLRNSSENTIVYITEGIIDALSIETIDPNIKTLSLNGTTNYKRLIELLNKYNYKGVIVLALDNDLTGKKYNELIKNELIKLEIPYLNCTPAIIKDGFKDYNEMLVESNEKFKKNIISVNKIISNGIKPKKKEMEGCEISL